MAISEQDKKNGEVYHGHEICMKKAIELLEECCLPLGLLPLEDVEECGIVRDTGFVWITCKKEIKHYFAIAGKQVRYSPEITAFATKGKLSKLKGVKAKELLLWVEINDIYLDDPPTGSIHFKGLAGITRTFPVEAFAPDLWTGKFEKSALKPCMKINCSQNKYPNLYVKLKVPVVSVKYQVFKGKSALVDEASGSTQISF